MCMGQARCRLEVYGCSVGAAKYFNLCRTIVYTYQLCGAQVTAVTTIIFFQNAKTMIVL